MTTIAMNYVVNPLAGFWRRVLRTFEIAGIARASAQLARLGYYEESKRCMMMIKELKASK